MALHGAGVTLCQGCDFCWVVVRLRLRLAFKMKPKSEAMTAANGSSWSRRENAFNYRLLQLAFTILYFQPAPCCDFGQNIVHTIANSFRFRPFEQFGSSCNTSIDAPVGNQRRCPYPRSIPRPIAKAMVCKTPRCMGRKREQGAALPCEKRPQNKCGA